MIAVGLGWWIWRKMGSGDDYRVAVVGQKGITMVNFSTKRKMINKVEIDSEAMVWVSGGFGWYQSGKINQLLKQEKKENLWMDTLFFNFGFEPKLIIDDRGEDIEDDIRLVDGWGWWQWLKYKINSADWLVKEDPVKSISSSDVDEIMLRDMADINLIDEPSRVMIYNSSSQNGLAMFLGKALERAGVTVTGWENADNIDKNCLVKAGKGWENTLSASLIKRRMNSCQIKSDQDLPQDEAEIYFGENFAQMLNYQSYKN